MEAEAEIGHADQHRIIGGLEPDGLHRDRLEVAPRRARFEGLAQRAATREEHHELRRLCTAPPRVS